MALILMGGREGRNDTEKAAQDYHAGRNGKHSCDGSMSAFRRFLLKRIAISIGLVLVATSVIFIVLRLLPGSPFTTLFTTGNIGPEQQQEIHRALRPD